MASSKRNFEDFDQFPGELNEGTGYYEFPLLTYEDTKNHKRMWQIFVRMVSNGKRVSNINWNEITEDQIPIKKEYFNIGTKIKPGIIAEEWSISGIENMAITKSSPTYFDEVTFKNQSNERNVFQTALIDARSKYLKVKERSVISTSTDKKYFPMLAKSQKDGERFINYPAFIQPKLDGVRCVIYLNNYNNINIGNINIKDKIAAVTAYTRTKKDFPSINYIKLALYDYLVDLYDEEKKESIYIDGELYRHGKKLQDISGDSRNEVTKSEKTFNQYHIYDIFYPSKLNMKFSIRTKQVDEIFKAIELNDEKYDYIIKVPTYITNSAEESKNKFDEFIALGYEGAILRNVDGPYLANADRTGAFMRSKDLVKMKKKFSDEYEVIGFTEGNGRDKGCIIWKLKNLEGIEFNVTPNIPINERKKLYEICKKNNKFIGQMLTVEYEDLSKDNVPQRAKGIAFRNFDY
jgi:ATP-dependent DNA ligase